MSNAARIPLKREDIALFEEKNLSVDACRKLLAFYQAYQEKNWLLFLSLRAAWKKAHPEMPMSDALCANIQPLSGEFRPLEEQRIWCWGDGRALGIWCYCLLANRIPDKSVTLTTGESVNMRAAMTAYCEAIYAGSRKRYDLNAGALPVAADPKTGLPDNHPWNPAKGSGIKTFSNLFSVTGWALYGMLKNDKAVVDFGLAELSACIKAIESYTFSTGMTLPDASFSVHGPRMITLGVIGEILKGITLCEKKGETAWTSLKAGLVKQAIPFIEYILNNHYRINPVGFWEKADPSGRPIKANNMTIVDPGHATELAGFLAELVPFLPETWGSRWDKTRVQQAAVSLHLYADRIGFSKKGVIYKAIDLDTEEPLPDMQALNAGGRLTAPWWPVREHCAAALRLYTLTQDSRLVESFRKGQHASYLHYPNQRIMDQMIQTVDPETLEPLDIAPATGNMDAMHDPRSRIREMENLEILLGAR